MKRAKGNPKTASLAYYVGSSFLLMSKSLPHGVLTVLLLSKGVDLPEIMFTQAVFSAAVFICEFPSGVISDLYNRKTIYLSSVVAWIISCSIIWLGHGFATMCLAWAIYGLAEALSSGTIDASLINLLKKDSSHKTEEIKSFKKISNQISTVSMIFGAVVGSYIYFRIHYNLYLVGIALALISAVPIILFFPSDEPNAKGHEPSAISQIKAGIKELEKDNRLILLVLLAAVSQIFFPTHFNLWQAYLLANGIDKRYLFWFYIVFQIIGFVAFSIPIGKHLRKILYVGAVLSLLSPLFFFAQSRILVVIAYCLSVFVFTFLQYLYDVLFSLRVSEQSISTLLTLNSTISRISGFIILMLNGILLKAVGLTPLLFGSFETATVLSILVGVYFMHVIRTPKV